MQQASVLAAEDGLVPCVVGVSPILGKIYIFERGWGGGVWSIMQASDRGMSSYEVRGHAPRNYFNLKSL